jgi:hypothetical protein
VTEVGGHVIDGLIRTKEVVTDVRVVWEVLNDKGEWTWNDTATSAVEAVSAARARFHDLEEAWDEIETAGGRPNRKSYNYVGVRCRTVTTVTTIEVSPVQPIEASQGQCNA